MTANLVPLVCGIDPTWGLRQDKLCEPQVPQMYSRGGHGHLAEGDGVPRRTVVQQAAWSLVCGKSAVGFISSPSHCPLQGVGSSALRGLALPALPAPRAGTLKCSLNCEALFPRMGEPWKQGWRGVGGCGDGGVVALVALGQCRALCVSSLTLSRETRQERHALHCVHRAWQSAPVHVSVSLSCSH